MPEDKAWMLREAFRWMGSHAAVCTQALSTLVGIWVFGALLRREMLSIPHGIFIWGDEERAVAEVGGRALGARC